MECRNDPVSRAGSVSTPVSTRQEPGPSPGGGGPEFRPTRTDGWPEYPQSFLSLVQGPGVIHRELARPRNAAFEPRYSSSGDGPVLAGGSRILKLGPGPRRDLRQADVVLVGVHRPTQPASPVPKPGTPSSFAPRRLSCRIVRPPSARAVSSHTAAFMLADGDPTRPIRPRPTRRRTTRPARTSAARTSLTARTRWLIRRLIPALRNRRQRPKQQPEEHMGPQQVGTAAAPEPSGRGPGR